MDKKSQYQMTNEYKQKAYKRVPLDLPVEYHNQLKSYCNAHNLKVNTFIKMCIDKCINEGFAPEQPEHKSYYNKGEK